LLYASNRRLEGWGSLDVGGPVELLIWRSVSSLGTAPMWVSPTQGGKAGNTGCHRSHDPNHSKAFYCPALSIQLAGIHG
jgi:hypothetical protein